MEIKGSVALVTGANRGIGADLDKIHDEFETNVFGPVYVAEAFAPVLEVNGGGAIVNGLSAVSWFSFPGMAGYSATKSAAWNLTDALRLELADQGTLVVGLQAGRTEILADEISHVIKSTLTSDPSRYAAILGG